MLNITIEELVSSMKLNNEKYYQQIINGYKDKDGNKKYKQPTIKYIFTGINYAMNTCDEWNIKEKEIKELVYKYLIKF